MIRCQKESLSLVQKLVRAIKTSRSGITPNNGKIYWHVVNFTPDLPKAQVVEAFEGGFKLWQKFFTPIEFESTSDPRKAAIKIHFMPKGDRRLPEPFDVGVLAYAFFPQGKSLGIHSDMYFNEDYRWQKMHTPQGISLLKVFVHEVGHALGLSHSAIKADIMFPTYQPNNSVVFSSDTVKGIDKLYKHVRDTLTPKEEPEKPPVPELPKEFTHTQLVIKKLYPHRFQITMLTDAQLEVIASEFNVVLNHREPKVHRLRAVWAALGL